VSGHRRPGSFDAEVAAILEAVGGSPDLGTPDPPTVAPEARDAAHAAFYGQVRRSAEAVVAKLDTVTENG
jgi:hypothetical protein